MGGQDQHRSSVYFAMIDSLSSSSSIDVLLAEPQAAAWSAREICAVAVQARIISVAASYGTLMALIRVGGECPQGAVRLRGVCGVRPHAEASHQVCLGCASLSD